MALSETVTNTNLFIDGAERAAEESFPVYDPHDGALIGHAAAASRDDALDAIAAAQAAWPAWAALPAAERAQRCLQALAALDTDFAERAEILSRENGKVRFEAEIDLHVFVGRFHQAAAYAPLLDTPEQLPGPPFRTTIEQTPKGLVTIIYPFNWPLAILAASLPYALMAGNTVIVKPPPTTPLSSVLTLRHVAAALPPGVLNVVTGLDAVVGPIVVGDPRIKHVCFTGSVGGGRRMMELAAPHLTNVTLELGGNDPALVLADASLDSETLGRLAVATFMTAGQVCMAVKRIYVARSRYDELVEGLRAVVGATKVGFGLTPGVTMGPLNSARQRDFVTELVAEARADGAEVVELGEYIDGNPATGNYALPSLVLSPREDLRIVTEEQFGPAIPVIPVDSDEEAIKRANATWAGLCSSVWSADEEHALRVGRRLRSGVTFFNDANATAVDERAPFGGINQSGIGRELGRDGLYAFTETHVLSVPEG